MVSRLTLVCALASLVASVALSGTKVPWQKRLDRALLDVDTKPRQRLKNLQSVARDPAVLSDVIAALGTLREKGFSKGHAEAIERILPTGTIARADLDALRLLRKQVPEGLAELRDTRRGKKTKAPSGGASDTSMSSSAVFQALSSAATDLVSDPSKREALRQEALNALRSTPKGLETPAYTVERTLDGGVELRNYEAYAIARLSSSKATASGNDFGALASYLFGANAESRAMEMTMPVETGSQGEGMAFVLPKAYAEAPPAPDSVDVEIAAVPARRVLALAFGGIATRNEIDRQRAKLALALAISPDLVAPSAEDVTVLQYNAPYTLPWRRRNEVVLRVDLVVDDQPVENDSDDEPPAPSTPGPEPAPTAVLDEGQSPQADRSVSGSYLDSLQ